ncbi:phytanoyl-CoA dioxygenase family protein [Candidatus Njordibacter sp. Uisw_039]|uniref:phytanoyl-CoA dioxygenase family protein n=1 Tax=Candidatus Njordibacter sp. Uisw_039 TaxID=3230972 RepID=UPI003D4B60B0
MKHSFKVDNEKLLVELDEDEKFEFGNKEILTQRFGDLTETKYWFDKGFSITKSSRFYDAEKLYSATQKAIKNIIYNLDPGLNLSEFSLENYHTFVSEELHSSVLKKTRRLFPENLDLDVHKILEEFSNYFGTNLTFLNPITGKQQWMIARINRAGSLDYNTAHKDVYEVFDKYNDIPRMVNVWIPLSGVNKLNSLPIVPKSHLLSEHLIKRTLAGSTMNGVPYSVASIKNWDGSATLSRVELNKDDVLIFSSHLIHGLAVNKSEDITRISFEFRLYEKS